MHFFGCKNTLFFLHNKLLRQKSISILKKLHIKALKQAATVQNGAQSEPNLSPTRVRP